jgi:hypothetical protein
MKQTYRIILINPDARTVLTVESNGSIEHLQQLVHTDFLEPLRVSGTDMLLFADEPDDDATPFRIGPQMIRGRAVIVGDGDTTFCAPLINIDVVRAQVEFGIYLGNPASRTSPPNRSAP